MSSPARRPRPRPRRHLELHRAGDRLAAPTPQVRDPGAVDPGEDADGHGDAGDEREPDRVRRSRSPAPGSTRTRRSRAARPGTGSYVAFGPNPALLPGEPRLLPSTSYYQVAVWARLSPPSVTDGQKAMNADGTFSFTFTTGGTRHQARRADRAVHDLGRHVRLHRDPVRHLTFRSQGNADRSQDTFTPVTFASAVSVTTTTLPAAPNRTQAYSQTLDRGGRHRAVHLVDRAGSLPAGLTLSPSTGVISGTTTAAVTRHVHFTVRVTDSAAEPASDDEAALDPGQDTGGDGDAVDRCEPERADVHGHRLRVQPERTVRRPDRDWRRTSRSARTRRCCRRARAFNVNAAYYEAMVSDSPRWAQHRDGQEGDERRRVVLVHASPWADRLGRSPRCTRHRPGTYDCTAIQCGVADVPVAGQRGPLPGHVHPGELHGAADRGPGDREGQRAVQHLGAAFAGVGPYTWAVKTGALPPGLTLNPATGASRARRRPRASSRRPSR